MSKKRIFVKLEGSDDTLPIAWYAGTPLTNIIGQIKQAFGINHQESLNTVQDLKSIGLYDQDGDLVVLSDSIPNDQVFTVKFLFRDQTSPNNMAYDNQNQNQQVTSNQRAAQDSSINMRQESVIDQNQPFQRPNQNLQFPPQNGSPQNQYYQPQQMFIQPNQQQQQHQIMQEQMHPQYQQQIQGQQYPPQYYRQNPQGFNNFAQPQVGNMMAQDPYWHQQQYKSQFQTQHVLMTPQTYYPSDIQSRSMIGSPQQSPNRFLLGSHQNLQPPQSVRMQPSARFNQQNQHQYANLQAMGTVLRGNSKGSSQSKNISEQSENLSQKKIDDKRNQLKKMVSNEQINIKKSPISSQESQDQVLSLRNFGGRAGSDNGDPAHPISYGAGSNQSNLLNTPLANTMKKIGMDPNLTNNKLNQFLVKKGSNQNTFSSQASPLMTSVPSGFRDGTGGPNASLYPQYQHLMPNGQPQQRQTRFNNNSSSGGGGYLEYPGSPMLGGIEQEDQYVMDENQMMGSPRLYPIDPYQQQNMAYQQRFIHSDETTSIHGDFMGMQNNLSPQMMPMRSQFQMHHQHQMFRPIQDNYAGVSMQQMQQQNQQINQSQIEQNLNQ